MYRLEFTRQAQKDALLIELAGLKPRALELLNIIKSNPYQNPPHCEKLQGLPDTYSRRNIQHRLVYRVFASEGIVRVIRMWTHYE
ncbi:MAG: Txe/YoeB family addiction module toxin [Treponema sp.]|jgi:Txe/YoeB family toxin of toxin-antitoxin system|nr:Txe/YoeB family addiction module toxin [Treponema sp.]